MNNFLNVSKAFMTLDEAVLWRQNLRENNKKLVVTSGRFDLLHRGHAEHLLESRKLGDALLVLLCSDEAAELSKSHYKTINQVEDRAFLLASMRAVDAVVIYDGIRCNGELSALSPDIFVKGGDVNLSTMDSSERQALLSSNTIICFKPFIGEYSTEKIMEKIRK